MNDLMNIKKFLPSLSQDKLISVLLYGNDAFDNKTNSKILIWTLQIRGGSRTAATSKMELFVILVNGFQPLTIITKCSILDVAAVLDPPLQIIKDFRRFDDFLF